MYQSFTVGYRKKIIYLNSICNFISNYIDTDLVYQKMKNEKSLEHQLHEIIRQRKILLSTKELLIKKNRNIIAEGRSIRKALQQSLQQSGLKRYRTN